MKACDDCRVCGGCNWLDGDGDTCPHCGGPLRSFRGSALGDLMDAMSVEEEQA